MRMQQFFKSQNYFLKMLNDQYQQFSILSKVKKQKYFMIENVPTISDRLNTRYYT